MERGATEGPGRGRAGQGGVRRGASLCRERLAVFTAGGAVVSWGCLVTSAHHLPGARELDGLGGREGERA